MVKIVQLDAIEFILLAAAEHGIGDAHLGISRVVLGILHINEVHAGRVVGKGIYRRGIRCLREPQGWGYQSSHITRIRQIISRI